MKIGQRKLTRDDAKALVPGIFGGLCGVAIGQLLQHGYDFAAGVIVGVVLGYVVVLLRDIWKSW